MTDSEAQVNLTPRLVSSTHKPSDFLRRIIRCHTDANKKVLATSTLAKIEDICSITMSVELSQGTFHDMESSTRLLHAVSGNNAPHKASVQTEFQSPTTRDIDWCCQYAVELFASILGNSKTPKDLSSLMNLLRKIGFTSWIEQAPEFYIWVCLTAASSAASDSTVRRGFVMMSMPVILALESTELVIIDQAWAYFSWLEHAHGRINL